MPVLWPKIVGPPNLVIGPLKTREKNVWILGARYSDGYCTGLTSLAGQNKHQKNGPASLAFR